MGANIRDRFAVNATDGAGGRFLVAPGAFFPDMTQTFPSGATTTTDTINKAYAAQYVLAAGATTTVDLTACTWGGVAQVFTKVRAFLVNVQATTTSNTDPVLTYGPMGVANGMIGPFGGTTGSHQTGGFVRNVRPDSGWAVTASNKVIQFRNDSGFAVTASFAALGIG